jgi:hypothetical protein
MALFRHVPAYNGRLREVVRKGIVVIANYVTGVQHMKLKYVR